MSVKTWLMEKMMEKQLKGVPPEQREAIIGAINKNPELFKTIGEEIKHKMKHENMDQMKATMETMKKYQNEIRSAMQ